MSLCIILLFKGQSKAQIHNLTLPEILEKTENASRSVKINQYNVKISEEKIKDAKKGLLPKVQFDASAEQASNFLIYDSGLFQTPSKHDVIHSLYSTNTNFYLNLYEGLKTKNTIALNELESFLEKELLVQKIAAVKLNAIYLFLDLYLQQELQTLVQSDIEDKKHQLSEIKDYYELGIVLQSDVLRADLELSKRKMTLIEIQNQQKELNQRLNVIIGLPDFELVVPELDINIPPSTTGFNTILEEANHHSYLEKISHLQVKIAEKKADLIKANQSLKIGLSGSFQFSNPQIFLYPYNPNWYTLGLIGLKLSYPISELYHNKHKKNSAELEIKKLHEHHKMTQDEIRTTVYTDFLNYEESQKYVTIYESNFKYANENARIIRDAYFNQTALITDLLDANLLALKSNFELKQAKINVIKNYFKLQYSKGTL